jgi:hypothetical protein
MTEKQQELARLKSLKKDVILAKLQQIKAAAGSVDDSALEGVDLEADYDEDQYERQMQSVFGQNWYAEVRWRFGQ